MAHDISRFLMVSFALTAVHAGRAFAQEPPHFEAMLREFLDTHCVACHGPEVQKRRLRLDRLPWTFDDKDVAATWVKVLDKLSRGRDAAEGRAAPG